MNWQEILTILIPLFGLMGWIYNRIEKKSIERHLEVKEEMKGIKEEMKDVKNGLQSLDSRVSRIEGHLTGMYHFEHRWEPKVIEKDDKK